MPRLDALTGMRWWAAFFVFTYHMLVFAPLPGVAAAFLKEGFYGVTFFFVLSGFVLTWSASPRVSQSTFYLRRFARVYPSHFVALLVAIPIFYSFQPDPSQPWVKPVSVGILALSFVLMQGWWSNPTILFSGNPAAWTLTCEAFFYAVHPYINRGLMKLRVRGAVIFAVSVLVIAFAYRAAAATWGGPFALVPLPVVRVSEFMLGMGLASALRCGWRPRIPTWVGLGSVIACICVIVLVPHYAPASPIAIVVSTFANELVMVTCGLAILAISQSTLAGRTSVFASRIMVRLGEWSFTFYLVHATVMYAVLAWIGPQRESWMNLLWYALLLAVDIAAAAALHYWVEKPIELRLRAWKDRRVLRRSALAG
jgi:peptidoglycan/LPS O-acetylase OafA/YrhL